MQMIAALPTIPARPSAAILLDRARALVPGIAARAGETAQRRDLPPDTIRELRGAGLMRGFQPIEWGGLELDPQVVFDIQNVLAEACASTAWIQTVLSVQAFMLARFPHAAQADVWGDDPDTLVCSSFMPSGSVIVAEDGYRLSGRWSFASGSSHCGWAVIGAIVPPGAGQDRPHMRLFLLPAADYRIDDVWHTVGLRGTGSNDLLVEDAFVPSYRTLVPDAGLLPVAADSDLADLYRMPWLYVFTSAISNLSLGIARGALNAFIDIARTRQAGPGQAARDLVAVHQAMAQVELEVDAADLVARRNLSRLRTCAQTGALIALSDALLYRSQLTSMLRRIAGLVDELMVLSGARALRTDSPLCRAWIDLSAARQHPGNDPARTFTLHAAEMFSRHELRGQLS